MSDDSFKRLLNEDDLTKFREQVSEGIWQALKQTQASQYQHNQLIDEKISKLKDEILNEVKLMLDFLPTKQ